MTLSRHRRAGPRNAPFAGVALGLLALSPDHARAAGSAYQVDTAEVAKPGSCKVETWTSFASNRDFIGALSPDCVFDLGRPVDMSAQFTRVRSDGDWATGVTPKMKTNLVPTAIGAWGFAVSGQTTLDLATGSVAAMSATIPATLDVSKVLRINLNSGWFFDRIASRHYATYGAAFDWRTPNNVWTLTGEVFGLARVGHDATPLAPTSSDDTFEQALQPFSGTTRPRFQAGIRFRPIDAFSVDLIYGRNITGENANWITAAMVVRW
jgi:hypothetical protein